MCPVPLSPYVEEAVCQLINTSSRGCAAPKPKQGSAKGTKGTSAAAARSATAQAAAKKAHGSSPAQSQPQPRQPSAAPQKAPEAAAAELSSAASAGPAAQAALSTASEPDVPAGAQPQPQRTPYRDPASYTPEPEVQQALQMLSAGKPSLHVVVLGHVDAGKSTLMGRLIANLGFVDERTVRKTMQEAQSQGRGSFGWAWTFDERPEERAHGVTIDVSTRNITTDKCVLCCKCHLRWAVDVSAHSITTAKCALHHSGAIHRQRVSAHVNCSTATQHSEVCIA